MPGSPIKAILEFIMVLIFLGVVYYLANDLNIIAYIFGKALGMTPSQVGASGLGAGLSAYMPTVIVVSIAIIILVIIIEIATMIRGGE